MRLITSIFLLILILTMVAIPGSFKIFDVGMPYQTSGEADGDDQVRIVTQTLIDASGNFFIAGVTLHENGYLAKFSGSGVLMWEVFLGGSGRDTVREIQLDKDGQMFVMGTTNSPDFPTTDSENRFSGIHDMFLLKVNPENGFIIWSRLYGGSDHEGVFFNHQSLLLNSLGEAIIWGRTTSNDLPLSDAAKGEYGGLTDVFLAKFDTDGNMKFSTYWGGTSSEIAEVLLDDSDNIIIAGLTVSHDLEVSNDAVQNEIAGDWDRFVSKFNPNGQILWSTYLGGSREESKNHMWNRIGPDGKIFTISLTFSADYVVSSGAFLSNNQGGADLVFTVFNSDGTIDWSTYFGGSERDSVYNTILNPGVDSGYYDVFAVHQTQMDIDKDSNLIFASKTDSVDLYGSNSGFMASPLNTPALFLTKFDENGINSFVTYIGGSRADDLIGTLQFSSDRDIYLTGITWSEDLIMQNANQNQNKGKQDGFIYKISATGELLWSTYLGGSSTDRIIQSFVDNEDNLIVLGETSSVDFPGANPTIGNIVNSTGFISKFSPNGQLLWSRILGGNGEDTLTKFSLIIFPSNEIIVTGATSSSDLLTSEDTVLIEGDVIAIIKSYNENGELNWSQYVGPFDINSVNSRTFSWSILLAILSIGAIIGTGIAYSFKLYLIRQGKLLTPVGSKIPKILSPIFNDEGSLLYLLWGLTSNKYENELFKEDFPEQIFDFKYFFNPVRLSIIRILSENVNLQAADLRDYLGIPWNEFTHHINSLKKIDFIHVNAQFIDGSLKNLVSVSPKAVRLFDEFSSLLVEFLGKSDKFEQYVKQAKDLEDRLEDADELYPK